MAVASLGFEDKRRVHTQREERRENMIGGEGEEVRDPMGVGGLRERPTLVGRKRAAVEWCCIAWEIEEEERKRSLG